ncbi:sensor histidine kinase [Desulfospira joergensenii]|uniref:sensor histidine kinase n=1 Tax=Desulfospira joergensenii TaxID=53329 RepID=UPI0003B4A0FC|nr:PAS domain-containing sensor histidine kinase [Desulfospira joergensenii]
MNPHSMPIKASRYNSLYRKIILLTMVCSLVPLLLAGWAINIHYSGFARERIMNMFQTRVEYHRDMIELFLKENQNRLAFIAESLSMTSLIREDHLAEVLARINREAWILSDIGIIDDTGAHRAYVGPYDLMDKNYANTPWFREVMEKGKYTSDMFMGFRKEPHFVMTVSKKEAGRTWILRATVNGERFRSLVKGIRIGRSGEVFLLNSQGIHQITPPDGGSIMTFMKGFQAEEHQNPGIRIFKTSERGISVKKVSCQARLSDPRWLLMIRMNASELFEEINHAKRFTMTFLHLSALIIFLVTLLMTHHMITTLRKRDREAEEMNRQLMQAGKLASIGELSAGVAHEINNPLAIIMTEGLLLRDANNREPHPSPVFSRQMKSSLNQIDTQLQRCKRITRNLLKFAQRTRSIIEPVDINLFLREVIDLMEREAKSDGIRFDSRLDRALPPILSDPSQLQQVFLNLINNAIEAHEKKGHGVITLATQRAEDGQGVTISVADTGSGIEPHDLDHIFDPFFTTKAPGKGTGLGLSICHTIVEQLGGSIQVKSRIGTGTTFILHFPLTLSSG